MSTQRILDHLEADFIFDVFERGQDVFDGGVLMLQSGAKVSVSLSGKVVVNFEEEAEYYDTPTEFLDAYGLTGWDYE